MTLAERRWSPWFRRPYPDRARLWDRRTAQCEKMVSPGYAKKGSPPVPRRQCKCLAIPGSRFCSIHIPENERERLFEETLARRREQMQAVRGRRVALGLTQQQLGERALVKSQTLCRLELGYLDAFPATLERLNAALSAAEELARIAALPTPRVRPRLLRRAKDPTP